MIFDIDNRVFVIELVSHSGLRLNGIPTHFKYDLEIVRAAVNQNGFALEYVPHEMKTREIILMAVLNRGDALKFAPDEFKCDLEIVHAAISNCATAVKFINEHLKNDREIIIMLLRSKNISGFDVYVYNALTYGGKYFKDLRIISAWNDFIFQYELDNDNYDRELLFAAVQCKPDIFKDLYKYIPNLMYDREIVFAAYSCWDLLISHGCPYADDWEMIYTMLKKNTPEMLPKLPEEVRARIYETAAEYNLRVLPAIALIIEHEAIKKRFPRMRTSPRVYDVGFIFV